MWLSEFDINPPPNSDGVDFDESQTPLYIDIDTIHTLHVAIVNTLGKFLIGRQEKSSCVRIADMSMK